MLRRWSLVFVAVLAPACSLTVDMDGYTGGVADTGAERIDATIDSAADSGAGIDSTVADSETVDSSFPDTNVVDTADTSVPVADSVADTTVLDTSVADTSVADTSVADTHVADTYVADTYVADSNADTTVTDTSVADTSTTDSGPSCHLVINELVTGRALPGSAVDELIELYNPCSSAIAVGAWKVVYRSYAGVSDASTLATLTGSVAPGAYVLIAGSGAYSKTPYTPDYTYSAGGLAASGGGVALRDDKGAIVDSVTWGDAVAGHAFTETTAAPAPGTTSTGQSIARTPNGKDTNDNSVDFVTATPTPKAAN